MKMPKGKAKAMKSMMKATTMKPKAVMPEMDAMTEPAETEVESVAVEASESSSVPDRNITPKASKYVIDAAPNRHADRSPVALSMRQQHGPTYRMSPEDAEEELREGEGLIETAAQELAEDD